MWGGGGCMSEMVDEGSVESHRYFMARRTILEMLRDRGCAIPADELALTLPAFRAAFSDQPDPNRLRITSHPLSDPSKKVLVIFCGTDPVKVPVIRGIYNQVKDENLTRLILIFQSKVTSKARDATKEIFKVKVETFHITELLVNITKHVLMPKQDILTEVEKKELLKKYNVKDNQLPRMLETDAFAQYYGLERGQVVKVTYDGEVTGSHVTYRCIV